MNSKIPILIVDDELLVRRALVRDLQRDFEVVSAERNAEALAILASNKKLRGVVSDYHIGMRHTGVNLLTKVSRVLPSIGRILVSGTVDEGAVRHLIDAGVIHAFMSKPWNRTELLRIVRTYCVYSV